MTRICRFDDNRLGIVEGDEVSEVSAVLDRLRALRWPVPPGDAVVRHLADLLPAARALEPSALRRPPSFRRIVTAHDESGRLIVRTDGVLTPEPIPGIGADFQTVWTTPTVPADLNRGDDGVQQTGLTLRGGSVIRIVDHLPGAQSPMHRTLSIDYGIILAGQLELRLDGGEVIALSAGDIVVQRGTNHIWRNPSADTVCRVAFILIEAVPVIVDRHPLGEKRPDASPRPFSQE